MDIVEEILKAREILGLPPLVTRGEIKRRYRELARRHHPDREGGSAPDMEALNRAYELLMEYVDNFRFRLDEEEIRRHYPDLQYHRQFTP